MLKGVNGNRLIMWPASACAEFGNMPIKPPVKLTNSAACARLRNSVLRWTAASSSPRVANIQRDGDRNQGDAVPQFTRTVAAAQIDRNHHAEQSSLNAVAMQFEVAPDGCRHQRENDIIHAGPAGLPYGLDFCQRNFSPGEFLWPAVENVESQPLCGRGEFRKQMGELVRGRIPAIRGEALRHARYVRQRHENSFDEFGIGIDAAVG